MGGGAEVAYPTTFDLPVVEPLAHDTIAAGLTDRVTAASGSFFTERCAASRLIGFRLGVGTVLGQTDELLHASAAEARTNGWAVHTHLAEVKEEVVQARLRWGETTVGRAGSVGLLSSTWSLPAAMFTGLFSCIRRT